MYTRNYFLDRFRKITYNMKKILFILCCAAALFSGCSAKKVNEDMAARDIPVEEQGLMDWIFYQVAPQLRTPNSNIGNRDTTRTKIKELTVNFKTNTCVLGKEISSSAGWIKNIYDKDEIPMANYACRSLCGPVDTTMALQNNKVTARPGFPGCAGTWPGPVLGWPRRSPVPVPGRCWPWDRTYCSPCP